MIRGKRRDGGLGHATFSEYSEYLAHFDECFAKVKGGLNDEIQSKWCVGLAGKLNVSTTQTNSLAFRRKVFDNILMEIGER